MKRLLKLFSALLVCMVFATSCGTSPKAYAEQMRKAYLNGDQEECTRIMMEALDELSEAQYEEFLYYMQTY